MTEDRFIFNAIVTGYYDIDTPDEYKEIEPQLYLEDVDVFSDEIGIDYDRLYDAVKQQCKDIAEPEIQQIMEFFQDNSNAYDGDVYVTIKPDKILQCTGLKDRTGRLIFEGDIVNQNGTKYIVNWQNGSFCFKDIKNGKNYTVEFVMSEKQEVIGSIYEKKELIEVEE